MARIGIALVVVVVAAAAFFLYRFLDDEGRGLEGQGRGGEAASAERERENAGIRRHGGGATDESTVAQGGEETEEVLPGSGRLRGQVVRRGESLGLAEVELILRAADDRVVARARSDKDGLFALVIEGPRPAARLLAHGPGLGLDPRSVPAAPEGEDLDLGRLELDPVVAVTGQVVAEDKKPIAGARVALYRQEKLDITRYDIVAVFAAVFDESPPVLETETDESGHFRFDDVPARYWVIMAEAEGRGRKFSRGVDAKPGHPADLLITLGEACAVAGIVKDEQGHPVADALVLALSPPESTEMIMRSFKQRSGADGRFRFESLAKGHVQFLCRAAGRVPLNAVFTELPREDGDIEIILGPEGEVEGRVYDRSTDKGLAGAEVIALQWQSGVMVMVETDAEGGYQLRGMPRQGELYLMARKAGYSLPESRDGESGMFGLPGITIQESELATGQLRRDIAMVGGASVSGRVYDRKTGLGIAGAKVRYFGRGFFFGVTKSEATETITDENGHYELKGLPEGGFQIGARALGYFMPAPEGSEDEDYFDFFGGDGDGDERGLVAGQVLTDVDIVLEKGVAISGRVVDPKDKGLPGAEVVWYPVEGGRMSRMGMMDPEGQKFTCDDQGRFRFQGLPPQTKISLRARHRSFPGTQGLEVELRDVDQDGLVVHLLAGGSLSGRLLHANGTPAAGIELDISFAEGGFGFGIFGSFDSFESNTRFTTDAQGGFNFEDLPPGEHGVSLSSDDLEGEILRDDSRQVTIATGERRRQDLHLEKTATISGRVLDPEGRAKAEVMVQASMLGDGDGSLEGRHGWAQTDEQGHFVISGLRFEREYELSADVWGPGEATADEPDGMVEMVPTHRGALKPVASGAREVVIHLTVVSKDEH
ncbi:MAG: carboxypeptidase regulatory-like domain-containing protein [Planctomycetes bacterium]|nr:carboxypeptidase regulatory-like domain-containing protein [Planctomycetota bacterium]